MVKPIYDSAEVLAGLLLKVCKCKVIPLADPTLFPYFLISQWIGRNIPDWKDFGVVGAAKVLGFYIGPEMADYNWIEPLRKFNNRLDDLKKAKAPLGIDLFDFNYSLYTPTLLIQLRK